MKKAIVMGIYSLLVVIMTVVMPVYAEEDILPEKENDAIVIEGEEGDDSENQTEPKVSDLGKMYEEKKLIAVYEPSFAYTGTEIEPEITLYIVTENEEGIEEKVEFPSECYSVDYNNNVNAGDKAEIIIKANGEETETQSYCGGFTAHFTITKKSLDDAKYQLAYGSTTYTGKDITPAVTVEMGGRELVNNQDYSVVYSDNKEIGTATVMIEGKGNYAGSKKLTFKIVLAVPKLSTETAYNKITVKWGKIPGATKYVLERSTSKSSGFKKIAEIKKGTTVKYTDKNVTLNKTYYYRIRAYRNSSKTGYSTVVSQKVKPAIAKITKVSRSSYNAMKVTWKKVSGASGYVVYRSTSEKGTYKKIATVKSGKKVTYTDKKCSCGVTYFYKVSAYRTSKGKKYYGSKSACMSANTVPTKIAFTDKTMSGHVKANLCWKKSSGASGYTIYRSTNISSGYTAIKHITKGKTLKWTDTGLDEKQIYYYKVRPYVTRNGEKIYGSYSATFKKELVSEKMEIITQYTSVPYRFGGVTPSGWDCSGFTKWAMQYLYGIEIGDNSAEQAAGGKTVSKSDRSKWQFGDILVYSSGGRINHVALYIGDNKIMHALNSKYDTIIHDVDYYENWDKKNNLKCVRRYH